MENKKEETKTKEAGKKTGNLPAALTYVGFWLTGIVFLLIEKDDKFVRFNAAQSLVTFGALTLFTFVPLLGQLFGLILWPLALVLWVVLMYKSYKNEKLELPVAGELAKKVEKSIK